MKVWEPLGEELSKKGIALAFSPAFGFWAGGLALLMRGSGGWGRLLPLVQNQESLPQLAIALFGFLCAVVASGHVVESLAYPTLRRLEGYWPKPLHWLRDRCVRRKIARLRALERAFARLAPRPGGKPRKPSELSAYMEVQEALTWLPDERFTMPTDLGNVLRVAETKSLIKYGLDGVVLWPRMWLLIPDLARKELADAREGIMAYVRLCLWGVLFAAAWSIGSGAWFFVPVLVGSIVASYAYFHSIEAARTYADLVAATFDLYRWRAYAAVGWPLPKNPADELEAGLELTQYLLRGSDRSVPRFPVSTPTGTP